MKDLRNTLYSEGACVYRIDASGDIIEIVAWARNQLAAKAAFEYLCTRDPAEGYAVRNRSWVLGERLPAKPANASTRVADRICDLREWHVVKAACGKCDREVVIGRDWLDKLNSRTTLDEIEDHLVCKQCGDEGVISLSVTNMPR